MQTHFNRAFLVVLFGFTTFTPGLYAQQAEIPPALPESTIEDSAGATSTEEPERIVEGRPALYAPKKALHPFSWIEFGLRPLAQGAERLTARFAPSEEKPPKVSGVKFNISGVGGAGSSSGLGPQITPFHNNLFGIGMRVEVPLSVTFRLYEAYSFRVFQPLISTEGLDRLGVELTGRYASRVSEAFYGVGNDAPYWSEARFRSVSRTAGVALAAQINDAWLLRVEEGYRSIGITSPRNYDASVTDAFKDAGVPGLSDPGATMLTTTASLQRNTKDRKYLASSGGLLNIEASLNDALTGGDFSYWRYRAALEQFIPLDEARRKVIALRATVETTQEKGGSIIPFYDLPTIGGRSTVRGLSSRRYTDKSAMSASAEYRYRIWRHMDWGFFVDAGQVAPEIGDFARNRLHAGYGMRFMVRATGDRAVSFDLGHSHEGWMFYIDFTPDF